MDDDLQSNFSDRTIADPNPSLGRYGIKKTYDIYLASYDKIKDKYTYVSEKFDERYRAKEVYEHIRREIKD